MFQLHCYRMIFRIHRMKDAPRESFRWAAHTGGVAIAKPKDYERAGEIDSPSPYAAWTSLRESDHPLETGDILEDDSGTLLIAKYIGFEKAQWWVPEPQACHPHTRSSMQAESSQESTALSSGGQ